MGRLAADEFKLSRTAINRYLRHLLDEGLLTATGKTNARKYRLKEIVNVLITLDDITAFSSEDTIWRFRVLPHIHDLPSNILNICQYGFTEIMNNVIDHSLSNDVIISYQQNYCKVQMMVIDSGIGIFEKLQRVFDLPDARSALLELSKGKLTSDKKRHTGWGIYFTSRMFDEFEIRSGDLFYIRQRKDDDFSLIETGNISERVQGTIVQMGISTDADWTTAEVFARYQGDDFRFRKTHVPIKLGNYPGEKLVSRSQAKRVLARFEEFSEVLLDFDDVDDIGPAFADEIFRVFHNHFPDIKIVAVRTTPAVKRMIAQVTGDSEDDRQETLIF